MAQITWPASVSAQLNAYTQRIQEEAIRAAESAVSFIHERTVERARLAEDWSPMADAIEVWSQDGRLVIGVRDEEMSSQAFALEYGDEVRPPSPLFRTLQADMEDAGQMMGEQMEATFGYEGGSGMPPPVLKAPPNLSTHTGFLLSEEESIKKWFTGITVPTRPDEAGTTKVECYFRYPEGERQIHYPFITIDLISVEPNFELWTSSFFQDPRKLYQPSVNETLPPLPSGMKYAVREYLAFNILWQVAVYARSALHDRYLTSIFTTDLLPARPFFIHTLADDVMRRTERVSFQTADTMETTESGSKRIFRKIYTVQMLTEIPQNVFPRPGTPPVPGDIWTYEALRVLIPVVARERFDTYMSKIFEGDDPMEDHTDEERKKEGEYFYIAHEGRTAPPAT